MLNNYKFYLEVLKFYIVYYGKCSNSMNYNIFCYKNISSRFLDFDKKDVSDNVKYSHSFS